MPTEEPQTAELLPEATSSGPIAIYLDFDDDVSTSVRSRMLYAFRVFSAVYGHAVTDSIRESATVRLRYGGAERPFESADCIRVPDLYLRRTQDGIRTQPPPVTHDYAGHTFQLFLGLDTATGKPDWLGEIFLWLSGELESGAVGRDAIGRIPYSQTAFGKHGISPRVPHAALLMAWLENALRGNAHPALPRAPSPLVDVDHIVLASHDVDFHYSDPFSVFVRLAKNLGIAALQKNPSFLFDNLTMMASLLAFDRPGDYLGPLLDAAQERGFLSTLFPVVRRAHRRDPNYSIEKIAPAISKAVARGFSLGLHGSYRSVMEDRSLSSEAAALGERFGKRPRANRQHWLRFESQRTLFRELESARMLADSSLGFPDSVGFRNGANFAFPPYDFERECPHRFLEIPLALMDGGLEAVARKSGQLPQQIAEEVLRASRNTGWGGMSVLWHNPIEPLPVPREINDVFWRCADDRIKSREAWLTFDQFLTAAVPRYQQAGLLEGVSVNA